MFGTIYALVDSRYPSRYRYVGQTVRELSTRLAGHKSTAATKYGRRTRIGRWFATGASVDIVPLQRFVPVENLREAERDWIKRLSQRGVRLLNVQHAS